MCTFRISLDDKLVNSARMSFHDDNRMTLWMEETISAILMDYVSKTETKSVRIPRKHDALMGVLSGAPEIDYKREHLKEKYGL